MSSSLVQTAPMTTSEWPLIYLVTECTTKSAPSLSGDWKCGEQNVLSTANIDPLALASSETFWISVSLRTKPLCKTCCKPPLSTRAHPWRKRLSFPHLESRIGGTFQPKQLSPWRKLHLDVFFLMKIHKVHRNVHAGTNNFSKITLRATIDIINAQNRITMIQQMYNCRCCSTSRWKGNAISELKTDIGYKG